LEDCERKNELIAKVQQHLLRLAELSRQEVDLIKNQHSNTWLLVDKQIEAELGEKERSLGALKEHIREHGC
jgi:hypothetical protein